MRWDYRPLNINPVFPGLREIIIIIIIIIVINIIIIIIILFLYLVVNRVNFILPEKIKWKEKKERRRTVDHIFKIFGTQV